MELALLPAGTASTPVSPEHAPRPSFPWALQQRPASFGAAPSALERSASAAPLPPRALAHGEDPSLGAWYRPVLVYAETAAGLIPTPGHHLR